MQAYNQAYNMDSYEDLLEHASTVEGTETKSSATYSQELDDIKTN